MPAIEVNGLRKVFGENVEAVAGIDLTVAEGEIFGFLGPNGAGKTTTTRMLTTLLKPTGGSARVAGFDIAAQPAAVRRVIGVALQDAGLDMIATGREFLVLTCQLHGMSAKQAKERAAELLNTVGLTDAADRRVKTYSGGMRRRLDLASALGHRPKVLFLDEPTAGLDPASRQAIWEEVVRFNREEGVSVFLTTQYLEEADRIAARIAIIDHGQIVAQGTPEELKATIGSEIVTLSLAAGQVPAAAKLVGGLSFVQEVQTDGDRGLTLFVSDGSGAVPLLLRALDEAALKVEAISLSAPTLDEVFLRATGSRLEGTTGTESA